MHYGQITFVIGNERIVRRVGGAVDSAGGLI